MLAPWMTLAVPGQNEKPEEPPFVGADPDAPVIHVKWDANGLNNGEGWKNAYRSLQDALSNAKGGEQIWIAQGTYCPQYDGTNYQSRAFHIGKGLSLYGGFVGDEDDRRQRDPNALPTIFGRCAESGDRYIIFAHGPFALDGFTFEDPNNPDTGPIPPAALFCPPSLDAGGVVIKNCVFRNLDGNEGSVLYAKHWRHIRFIGCQFIDNEAWNGGVMYLDHCEHVLFDQCVFRGNSSRDKGGCIFNDHTSDVVIKDSEFHENKSKLGGGVVYNDHSDDVHISGCGFRENECENDGDGGACIVNDHSNRLNITDCRFESNVSMSTGGAIHSYFSKDHVVEDCEFEKNWARRLGGGALAYGPRCSARIVQCLFIQNQAGDPNVGGRGGVILARDTELDIINCRFSGNKSKEAGGVMVLRLGSSVTLFQCVFNQNRAGGNGGVIFAESPRKLAVYNCTFSGNTSQGHNGGGIYIGVDEQISLERINPFQSMVFLYNSIFWGNQDSEDNNRPPDMFVSDKLQAAIKIRFCCIQGWDRTIPGADVDNVMDMDPLFVDPNGHNEIEIDDFELKWNSPYIDEGIAFDMTDINSDELIKEMLLLDLAGNSRVNGRIDLGPLEYHGPRR